MSTITVVASNARKTTTGASYRGVDGTDSRSRTATRSPARSFDGDDFSAALNELEAAAAKVAG